MRGEAKRIVEKIAGHGGEHHGFSANHSRFDAGKTEIDATPGGLGQDIGDDLFHRSIWAIKILSTTVGETGADYLAVHVGRGASLTAICMTRLLIAVLLLQLSRRAYVPWIYWLTVVLVSIVGTQLTDLAIVGLVAWVTFECDGTRRAGPAQ